MTATAERTTPRASRLAGYLFALAAGAIWGTTGPLSTALYRAGEAITGIGFWRLAIGLLGFVVYGLFRPQLFRIDRKAWLLVGLGGGALRRARLRRDAGALSRDSRWDRGARDRLAAGRTHTAAAPHDGRVDVRAPALAGLSARGQLLLLRCGASDRCGAHFGGRDHRAGGGCAARPAPLQATPLAVRLARSHDGGRRRGHELPLGSEDGGINAGSDTRARRVAAARCFPAPASGGGHVAVPAARAPGAQRGARGLW